MSGIHAGETVETADGYVGTPVNIAARLCALAGVGEVLVSDTVVDDGAVAGNIGAWEQDGRRLVGYWVGREFWGRGLATAALAELVQELDERPLHAGVAATNVGSIRVLEKCGFVEVERHAEHNEHARRVVEEILYRLD